MTLGVRMILIVHQQCRYGIQAQNSAISSYPQSDFMIRLLQLQVYPISRSQEHKITFHKAPKSMKK